MKLTFDKEDRLNKFLLGELSESERAALEDRVLSDDDFFEQLLVVEDDLIDAYVRNELPARERKLFEARFQAGPQNLERLEFAKTLRRSFGERPGSTRSNAEAGSWWQTLVNDLRGNRSLAWATAVVLVAVALGGIWIFINRSQLERPNEQALNQQPPTDPSPVVQQSDNANASGQGSTTPSPLPVPSPSLDKTSRESNKPVVATFLLTPGILRDAGSSRDLVVPPGTTHVSFQLPLEQGSGDGFRKYHLSLSLADGRKIWSGVVKPIGDRTFELTLPVRHFQRGDYVIELKGATATGDFESVAEYSFRILQK